VVVVSFKKKNAISYKLYIQDLKHLHSADTFLKAHMYVEIPEDIKVAIHSENGNISIENISCEFSIVSENGNVSFSNAGSGSIEAKNGDVLLKNISNNFDIKSTNGAILIENGIGGVLKAISENGDIKVLDADFNRVLCKVISGTLRVELSQGVSDMLELISKTGDIHFKMDNFGCQNILLSTDSGDIKILVPKDKMVNLDLTSELGEIKCKVDAKDAYEEIIDSNRFFISYADDLSNIMAKTNKGDITVNERDFNNKSFSDENNPYEFTTDNEVNDEIDDIVDEIVEHFDDNIDVIDSEIDKSSIKYKLWKMGSKAKEHVNKEKITNVWSKSKDGISKIKDTITKKGNKSEDEGSVEKSEATLKILEMVEKKVITVEEAEKLLRSINR